ncbi:MAG: hypothetical protein RBQ97_07545 [Acholeplasma sp.]|nr:hypothetical protein [Acholeplasma sp.]
MENRITKHVIMFSGGASSAYVAKWVVDKYGIEKCILLFTDTLWEDKDNIRFMEDVADYIGIDITRIYDGRTPEEVFFQQKFLGNARFAKCSEELKVRQTLIYTDDLRNLGFEPVLYFGIGPHEKHRADNLTRHYEHFPPEPVKCVFPMIDSISADCKAKYIIENEWGIKLPRMYDLGFSHANCGGRCVRGGLHHYAKLYQIWPDQYKLQEDMEERFNSEFNLSVSIMKKDGKPYPLKLFREEFLDKLTKEELLKYSSELDEDNIPCFCSFS